MVNSWSKVLMLAATAVLFVSCSSKQPLPTEEEKQAAKMQVPCIIALPVMVDLKSDKSSTDQSAAKGENSALQMELEVKEDMRRNDNSGFPVGTDPQSSNAPTYQSAANLEKGAGYLDQALKEALEGRNNVRFLSQRQLTSLLPETEMAQVALLRSIRSKLKCNAVLVTTLSRYVQRVGGNYGVDSPASVAFSMKLFDTSDASVIWSATFNETQASFMSNLMSAHKYGLKWLTVEELVTLGVDEKVAQCPYL
ncbi:MAG: hypothetical protein ACR2PB_12600 [Desulfocapsaceae bacterium]